SAGYLRGSCGRLPAAYDSSLSDRRWHSGKRRKPRTLNERRWTLRGLQLGRDEPRGKRTVRPANLFARYLRGSGRFLQALDAFTLRRSERGVGGGGKHSPFRQLFGTLRRVSDHPSEPFRKSGFRAVEDVRKRHQ